MKLFEKDELKILWPFYAEAFFGTFLYIAVPFMVLYFNSIGLTLSQIGIIMAVWPLASLIFEIPTGAIADIFGRKYSVIFGWFLQGLITIGFYFTKDYYALIGLFALYGISGTLISGSYEALIVDNLKLRKKDKLINKFFSKSASLYSLAFVISGFIGTFIVAKFGISAIWIVSGIAFFISMFIIAFVKESYIPKTAKVKKHFLDFKSQIKSSVKYSYKHAVLFYLLIITFISVISSSLDGFISWTPFLKEFNFPDYAFGYLWSAMNAISFFAPIISQKFFKEGRERKIFIILSVITLVYGFAVLIANNIILLISILLFSFFIMDFEMPIRRSYFHRFVPTNMRATIGSLDNMSMSLAKVIGIGIAGFLVEWIGGRDTIFLASLLMIPIIILLLKIKEEKASKNISKPL